MWLFANGRHRRGRWKNVGEKKFGVKNCLPPTTRTIHGSLRMEENDSRSISIHLFAEASDQHMSKLAMEILSGPNPSVAILRAKDGETENSLWYNAGRHQGKFAGAGGGIPPPPSGETRFFNPCNSKTHWESACWPRGPCSKCGKHGHRAEWCQNDPVSPPDLEQAKAAGENLKCYLSSIKTTKTR